MINRHHCHIKCPSCGERHTPGNPEECIEVLLEREADHAKEIEEKDKQILGIKEDFEAAATSCGTQAEQIATLEAQVKEKDKQIARLEKLDGERLGTILAYQKMVDGVRKRIDEARVREGRK